MSIARTAGNYSMAIQQRIAAAHQFDGTLPAADCSQVGLIYKYTEQNAGGLFFFNNNESIIISQFHVDLGASGDLTLSIVNLDPASPASAPTPLAGESIMVESVTGQQFVALDEARFKIVLLPGQALQLISSGSAVAKIAQCVGAIERTYIR
jgi:hypothetical protein